MIQNPDFTLIKLENDYHILPVCQGIADFRRGIRINESGALLWQLLENDLSREALLNTFIDKHYNDPDPDVISDLNVFLDSLYDYGFIIDNTGSTGDITSGCSVQTLSPEQLNLPHYLNIKIGTIGLRLFGDSRLYSPNFSLFTTADNPSVVTDILVADASSDHYPIKDPKVYHCNPIIRCIDFCIYSYQDAYIIKYPDASSVETVIFSADGLNINVFVKNTANITDAIREEILHAIRLPFLYLAARHGLYAIHSASILYRDKAWLFSAASGTGKSTLARMWTAHNIAEDINGDLNLIGMRDCTPVVYGLPWCGTSNIYTDKTYPLGGIAFLKRAENNKTELLTPVNGLLSMSKRIISPIFTPADLSRLFEDLRPVAEKAHLFTHRCTNSPESRDTLRKAIDKCSQFS